MNNHHEALVKSQFGGQAAAYLQSNVHAQGADLRRLSEWLSEDSGATVLDVGCGTGFLAMRMADLGHTAVGIDLSEEMLAEAQR